MTTITLAAMAGAVAVGRSALRCGLPVPETLIAYFGSLTIVGMMVAEVAR